MLGLFSIQEHTAQGEYGLPSHTSTYLTLREEVETATAPQLDKTEAGPRFSTHTFPEDRLSVLGAC